MVATIQVDQVLQNVQQGRLSLVTAQANLETSVDSFKQLLGLPPWLEVQLDESLLEPFELNDPTLEELRQRNEALYLELLQPDQAPPAADLAAAHEKLLVQQQELEVILDEVAGELERWKGRLERGDREEPSAVVPQHAEQAALAARLGESLATVRESFAEDLRDAGAARETLPQTAPDEAWQKLRELVGRRFRDRLADLFLIETYVRVHLIELESVDLDESQAIALAQQNRLDLMNQQARVADAWRAVEVAADALEADLDAVFEADIATDPTADNPIRFRSSTSRYRVGLEFDGPLTRQLERNNYRASQIAYQKSRRDYMALADQIVQQIRADVRNLETNRLRFEITRQQLLTAARQVEEAQLNLRGAVEADSSVTQDLLNALQTLLGARDSLIGNWVAYEQSRMNLYRDIDVMQIDAQGVWSNEHDQPVTR
jgi:outer membrane protein TolC